MSLTKGMAVDHGADGIRVNCISAGPLASRAAIAIKKGAAGERNYIDYCIDYNMANSPLPKPLYADDVGRAALSLCSELSGAVTGTLHYVDNGMHAMALLRDGWAYTIPATHAILLPAARDLDRDAGRVVRHPPSSRSRRRRPGFGDPWCR